MYDGLGLSSGSHPDDLSLKPTVAKQCTFKFLRGGMTVGSFSSFGLRSTESVGETTPC